MTQSGADFLKLSLDPFHDYELTPVGIPDAETSKVVIQTIKETFQLSAPEGTTDLWSAHIFNLPETHAHTVFPAMAPQCLDYQYRQAAVPLIDTDPVKWALNNRVSQNAGMLISDNSKENEIHLGLLNIHTFKSDQPVFSPSNAQQIGWSTAPVPDSSSVLGSTFGNYGRRRLVALAFEIHDTTAKIYKQGSLTSYRIAQSESINLCVVDGNPELSTGGSHIPNHNNASYLDGTQVIPPSGMPVPKPYRELNAPPSSMDEAMAYSGTRQWQADKGAYVVCQQDINRNVLKFSEIRPLLITQGEQPVKRNSIPSYSFTSPPPPGTQAPTYSAWAEASADYIPISDSAPTYAVRSIAENCDDLSYTAPFHTSGVMLTGLSPQSTFTVTLRATWEYAPHIHDEATGNLVFLAKPSPPIDELALTLYQRASIDLPTAVPVDMNAKGDFWDMTLKALSVAVPSGLSLLGAPGAAVGAMIGSGLNTYAYSRNKRDFDKDTLRRLQTMQLGGKVGPPPVPPRLDNTNFNAHSQKPKGNKRAGRKRK